MRNSIEHIENNNLSDLFINAFKQAVNDSNLYQPGDRYERGEAQENEIISHFNCPRYICKQQKDKSNPKWKLLDKINGDIEVTNSRGKSIKIDIKVSDYTSINFYPTITMSSIEYFTKNPKNKFYALIRLSDKTMVFIPALFVREHLSELQFYNTIYRKEYDKPTIIDNIKTSTESYIKGIDVIRLFNKYNS